MSGPATMVDHGASAPRSRTALRALTARLGRSRWAGFARRAGADARGVSAIEFALILPVMVIAILGSFQVFWIARAQMLAVNAARVLADIVSQQNAVSTADITDFCKAAQLSMQPMPSAAFTASIASVTNQNASRKIDWTDKTCGTVSAIGSALTTAQTVTPNDSDTAIVVEASYTVALPFSFPLSSTFVVNATAVASPRTGTTVTHS